ncbi:TrmH family RNA methyltransferase [Oceanobacillus chungangensis]|uniref:RNA methyltransferase n=1 Tax=Oceanobacillus chungangensis TaxID=1229152 RepID=A0A3D8Q1A3_9BACI|nr:RNA methyltransferase [Oceanobacillus chungangensis]RDW21617.1 RNA methyltransferase [Oceanobacillus chungangensis]
MITSIKNERVKAWKKLHNRKERNNTKTFLIEGFHLLDEAWKSDWVIREIIAEEAVELPNWCQDYEVERVSALVFEQITQTQTPQGVAAVLEMKEEFKRKGKYLLLIDSVQDPGNLGTMIRTADAAGMDGIVLGHGTVDVYNDKVIRSTQGSIFHLPIYQANLIDEVTVLKQDGFKIWATALQHAKKYNEIAIDEKVALILGNEGAGVKQELIDAADEIVTIPIYGKAESLNVSIAAGILMYYLKR